MEQIIKLLEEILAEGLIDMVLSGPKNDQAYIRLKVRPVMIRDEMLYQVEKYTKQQVFHENLTAEDMINDLAGRISLDYRQTQIRSRSRNVSVLVSKKGKVTVRSRRNETEGTGSIPMTHNREKNYILQEGRPVPFMVDLGVMTKEGRIVRSRYDKYRQINRFLEFIEDILPELPTGRTLTIIDFGCGKSYLTFAMYYYLRVLKGYDLRIIGLDLKETVIKNCQKLADDYGYDGLTFLCGDIKDYEGVDKVDMVVTLHACDTATDYALYKAVSWDAQVILSVPCCQHELNQKMEANALAGAFQYGLVRERTAALMTDAMRGQLLELHGFKVQLLEFIDMEHTPKNILIRAVRHHKLMPQAAIRQKQQAYEAVRDMFGAQLTLERLFAREETEADA